MNQIMIWRPVRSVPSAKFLVELRWNKSHVKILRNLSTKNYQTIFSVGSSFQILDGDTLVEVDNLTKFLFC